ncbi:chaperonin-containing T-complex member BBS12-like [Glandiceps talaboti]
MAGCMAMAAISLLDQVNHHILVTYCAMEAAMDSYKRQMQGEFNINKITGPPQTELMIEDGLIAVHVLEPRHLKAIFDVENCRHHCILLINGDIKPTSRHTGYKESLSILPVGHIGDIKLKTSWLDDIVQVLQELNIGILAMKGVVNERLHDYCMSTQIVVVEKVKYHALQALAISTHANIVIYTTDAIQEDVGTVVSVECWESGWQPKTGVRTSQLKRTAYVKLTTQGPLQTVILCGPSTVKLTILEESFQNCVHRLQDVISTDKVLPGGGVPELKAMQCIQRMKG